MKPRLIIIGNGMAATRLLSEIYALCDDTFRITVIGAEPEPGYNRVLLSRLLSGEIEPGELVTHELQWYADKGIELITNTRVTEIDRNHRCITLDGSRQIFYDQLVLATGARPFLPPVAGLDLQGVMTFRDMEDCRKIHEKAGNGMRVAVIGGGLLGLEAAHGVNQLGAKVAVVHNADWLLNRQLDAPAAALLQSSLESRGIEVHLGARLASIKGDSDGTVNGIVFENGGSLDCEAVVLATGITPNKELAEQCNLRTNRGICVDGWLRTDDASIYALGECAEVGGHCIGLVEPAWQQASVLAQVLSGNLPQPWQPQPVPTQLKVSGEAVFSAGIIDDQRAESLTLHDPVAGHYRHLLVRNQLLVGTVLYGDTDDGHFYHDLMRREVSIKPIRQHLLFGPQACGVSA
ncbi:MAG: FAD-dependent oxidoreductase [Alcanivoracaceae bacterium]|nr:FAD-dependent oxidoreductase [Alcanivoracaceae bacterium]